MNVEIIKGAKNKPNQPDDSSASGDCRPASCSPDRKMIFHVCQKLEAVLGLNEQEFEWLASLGAKVPKENVEIYLESFKNL